MGYPGRWTRHKPLPKDILERLEKITPIFDREGVLLAYIFGSLSDKGEKPRTPNDVDLAILTRAGPAYRMSDLITDALGTDRLDLVDLRSAPPVLRFEIIRGGRPIYVRDQDLLERYELETIHLYRDTFFMRRRQQEYLKERMGKWLSEKK